MDNNIQKTIDILAEELKYAIADIINDSNVPFYVIQYILKDMYMECAEIAKKQLSNNISKYDTEMKKVNEDAEKVDE